MKKNRTNYYVKSIKKALTILNSFTYNKYEMSLDELSAVTNFPRSSVRRILITLEDENVVKKVNKNGKYQLGIKLLQLGQIVKSKIEIRFIALPIMEELSKKTGENIELFFHLDNKRISLEKIESPYDLREKVDLKQVLPLYAGAPGKAILAFLTKERIDKIIAEEKLIPLGPKTITNVERLKNNLIEIQRKGYSISFEELVPGWFSIAAPIFNEKKEVVASIGVSGASIRFSKSKRINIISLVKEAANKISISIGF